MNGACPKCGCVGFITSTDIMLEHPDGFLKTYPFKQCGNCGWENMLQLIIQNGGLVYEDDDDSEGQSDLETGQNN